MARTGYYYAVPICCGKPMRVHFKEVEPSASLEKKACLLDADMAFLKCLNCGKEAEISKFGNRKPNMNLQ
jgi:hypothetical protein